MKNKRLLTTTLLLSWLFAGQIEFERYTIDDGLSQNTVQKVMQDSRGYIWLGTQGGLDRFNGYEFVHYESESSDSTTIPFGYIWSIEEDKNGIMWLGTQRGNVGWFNPYSEEAGEINIYKNNPTNYKNRTFFLFCAIGPYWSPLEPQTANVKRLWNVLVRPECSATCSGAIGYTQMWFSFPKHNKTLIMMRPHVERYGF